MNCWLDLHQERDGSNTINCKMDKPIAMKNDP